MGARTRIGAVTAVVAARALLAAACGRSANSVLDDPQDPYTQRLRASVLRPGWKPRRRALTGAGEEPEAS
jgi:hypothetical protein